MLKKIILAVFITGFIGILVIGGINRTQAKSNDAAGRNEIVQSKEGFDSVVNTGSQSRGNLNQEESRQEECDDDGPHGKTVEQNSTTSSRQENGSGNAEIQTESQEQGRGNRGGRGSGNGQWRESDALTESEMEALRLALDDEYHALAVYQSVIATFGEVEPFSEIALSEQRHIDALINQFQKQGMPIPENPWIGHIPAFDSIQQACETGVEAEIANVGLYDQLFSMTDDPSLIRVFTNLSNASLNSHLPQFEDCQ